LSEFQLREGHPLEGTAGDVALAASVALEQTDEILAVGALLEAFREGEQLVVADEAEMPVCARRSRPSTERRPFATPRRESASKG
ncbi:MAG: hypothetical protein ACREQV_06205, partial [Candidatus Binatia bacterium]